MIETDTQIPGLPPLIRTVLSGGEVYYSVADLAHGYGIPFMTLAYHLSRLDLMGEWDKSLDTAYISFEAFCTVNEYLAEGQLNPTAIAVLNHMENPNYDEEE